MFISLNSPQINSTKHIAMISNDKITEIFRMADDLRKFYDTTNCLEREVFEFSDSVLTLDLCNRIRTEPVITSLAYLVHLDILHFIFEWE